MGIKLSVFDLDGVLIKENCYASKLFEKRYGISHEEFYQVIKDNKMVKRTKDKGCNFELFKPLLKKYNIKISKEKFWELWLTNFKTNQDVIDFVMEVKKSGKKIGILSDNFVERAEYIRDLEWVKEFDFVFFSSDFGFTKDEPKLFQILVEKTGLKPDEIFFVDDHKKNVEVAKSVGINGLFYTNFEGFADKTREIMEF